MARIAAVEASMQAALNGAAGVGSLRQIVGMSNLLVELPMPMYMPPHSSESLLLRGGKPPSSAVLAMATVALAIFFIQKSMK
ncbi:hypothetical protein [uncultured Acetobacteroides sp.]|uniref:hypothetical protein n=1 Tax=uncultured Acetobacteroides sp. TaxID=1760811 RepID=UPI0029F46446|nr:hypothetical protein [uncultured Acetobacteroides sp.]